MSKRPSRAKIRLYVDQPLGADQTVALSRDQANYLFNVMRLSVGADVALFNGSNGEWRAEVEAAGKRQGILRCKEMSLPQGQPPDLWLLFAPVKKAQTDFIVDKAVELGAARICPVQTQFTNSERLRQDRLQAHAVEAAEQCGATYVPAVSELQKLSTVMEAWPDTRGLLFADETRAGPADVLASLPESQAWAILIGPEGGFAEAERAMLRSKPFVTPISLGPRILRAETAALAALTLWQATKGDWR